MIDALVTRLKSDPFHDAWKVDQYVRLAGVVAPLVEGTDLLDLGCGEGLFSAELRRLLAPRLLVGIDIAEERSWGAPPAGVAYLVGDAGSVPLRAASVDTVVAKDLLHHMEDATAGVLNLVRTARRRVVIVEANLDNPVMAFYTRHNGDQHLSRAAFEGLLRDVSPDVDWRVSQTVAYPFYLPPVRTAAALWVWPLTALMLVAFKLLRLPVAARLFAGLTRRAPWPPPFNVAVGDVVADG